MIIKTHLPAYLKPRRCAPPLVAALGVLASFALPTPAAHSASFPSPLESVRVSGEGGVTFQSRLAQGELYLLKASGSAGADIDVEPKTLRAAPGAHPTRMQWTGASHAYYMVVNGNGGPLTLKFLSPAKPTEQASDKRSISVSLYRLSAPPTPLETLQIPLLQKMVPTLMTTRKSTVYLLQAIGQGRVGGGGLGQGDAEYMDYGADGAGQVDVGDGNTDYGLGVDEADLAKTPHVHWWGPWRQDHTYDMVFEGIGNPIQFMFYDVSGGYGDNSATDTLTVKIYALP